MATLGDVSVEVETLGTVVVFSNCVVLTAPTLHMVVCSPSLLKTDLPAPVWVQRSVAVCSWVPDALALALD